MEKRWRMMKDYRDWTSCTCDFHNQEIIDVNYPSEDNWYKGEMIEVNIKDKK